MHMEQWEKLSLYTFLHEGSELSPASQVSLIIGEIFLNFEKFNSVLPPAYTIDMHKKGWGGL